MIQRPLFSGVGILAASVLLIACSGQPDVIAGCESADGVTPICGFQNPEDLVLLPGGSWLVVSQFVSGETPGSLEAYRVSDGTRHSLFPVPDGAVDLGFAEPALGWGQPDCPGPPDDNRLEPHGIDLGEAPNGGHVLAVVNHGEREAVELFEVGYANGAPALGWRGCVLMPDTTWPNDVSLLPGGGLVVTNMLPSSEGVAAAVAGIRMLLGADTGTVIEWQADTGWTAIADSEASGPNGIAVSPDGSQIFIAEWGTSNLIRVERSGESRRLEVGLPMRADNLSWARDGRLLITGQVGGLGTILGCGSIVEGTCAVPFVVVAAEPATLEVEVVLEHPASATGAASAAIHVGGELFIGTFAGDRLARVKFADTP